ncbi:MAG: hypothetical protein ABJH72_14645 [Reichenbachiella sp.]|uniref:hypothetical protein n=1 Tax=Reichenbachiella sp. TaxID=2184521 RepID=UPI0032665369
MKKILILVCLMISSNYLFAQNSTIDGQHFGDNKDVFIVNWDNTSSADAAIRLATYRSGYKHWNIFNERENNSLHFSYSTSSSGGNIGTRFMSLTNGGNLGIGTKSPSQKLHVVGNAYITGQVYGRSVDKQYSNLYRFGGLYLTWDSDSYGTNTHHSIRSTLGNTYGDDITINTYDKLRINLDANNNNSDSYFEIGHNTTATSNSIFRVMEDGKVGIGTTGPGNKLDVAGGIDINDYIRHNGDENTYIGFGANDQFRVRTNNADRLFINSSGYIGVGTTSPTAALHITGTGYDGTPNKAGTQIREGIIELTRNGTTPLIDFQNDINGTNYDARIILNSDDELEIDGASLKMEEGSINLDDHDLLNVHGFQMKDWDDNTGGSDSKYRLLARDGAFQFYNGGVVVGSYGNDTWTDLSDGNLIVKSKMGIATTSPDHALSIVGKLSLAKTADENIDYIRLYHDTEANLSTEEGALHFRKGTEEYLSLEHQPGATLLDASGRDLVFKAYSGGTGDLSIKNDGTVVVHNGFELEGNLNISNTELGNEDEYVLSLGVGNEIHRRSVESLTPWVIRQVYHDADTVDVLSCNPHAEGETCTCEPGTHVTIDAGDIIDIEGNLALGLQGFIDNDEVAGPNLDVVSGAKTVNDDYIRIQESIEFSSSSSTRGLVLLDNTVGSGDFLNFFHDGGISYFSNSTNSTPDADYFMKAGTGVPAEKNYITFADRAIFNNGFITSSFNSPDQMTFAIDTDNAGDDALFQVGRGTHDVADETNWFGLFEVDKNGVATFSSDIGDAQNLNRVIIDGSTGNIDISGDQTVDGTASITGALQAGSIVARLAGDSETKAITVFNTTDNSEVFRVYNNGLVEAKEVLVSLEVWHDEVFEDDYSLMPVDELEDFVNKNHHLPEVPAEEEVISKGVNLGQMEAILLKKIEELTLYVIDQNRELKKQAEKIKQLESKMD